MFRILDIKPKGSGDEVEVAYFDDETYTVQREFGKKEHIIPTIELVKDKYPPEKVMSLLSQKYPERQFEVKPYGFKKDSYVIWAKGPRKFKKDLELHLKKNKQIFITNHEHRFHPRTININDSQTLNSLEKKVSQITGVSEIERLPTNLKLKTNKRALRELPPNKFLIVEYESEMLTKEEAEQKKKAIKKQIPGYIDGLNVFGEDDDYRVRVRTISHPVIQKKFKNFLLKEMNAREISHDPLDLNSPKKQLLMFHPIYSQYLPGVELEKQEHKDLLVFKEDLEDIVKKATTFYKKNTAVVDLEVTDYTKNVPLSGNIFMAVLKSETENKLYMTSKVHNKKIRAHLNSIQEFDSAELIYLDNEKALAERLFEDANKYEFVMGFNIDKYDEPHLKKLGDIWQVNKNERILDALKYVENRLHLTKDKKLGTIGKFKKSIDYGEMERLVREKKREGIEKIVRYTLEDGSGTWNVLSEMIELGVTESIAVNKPLTQVFRNKPSKNHYDSGQRLYFLKLNTYRDRHEFSKVKHFKKFKERKTNEELLKSIHPSSSKYNRIEGELYYPTTFIEPLKAIIHSSPAVSKLYDDVYLEKDILKKLLMLSVVTGKLTVPVDKIKNYMESLDLEFGKFYDVTKIYPDAEAEEKGNQTSFIFAKSYDVPNYIWQTNDKSYDATIINYNNEIARKIEETTYEHAIRHLLVNANRGIPLGKIKALQLEEGELIGKLDDMTITLGRKYPKQGYLKDLLDTYLQEESIDVNEWLFKMPEGLNPRQTQIVKAALQVNPLKKHKNQGYLF